MATEMRAQRLAIRLMQLAVILRPHHLPGSDEQHRAPPVVLRKIFGVVPSGNSASPAGFALSPLGAAVIGTDWDYRLKNFISLSDRGLCSACHLR